MVSQSDEFWDYLERGIRTVARPIKPPQIAGLILRAQQSGWVPENPGPLFVMRMQNNEVFEPDASA